MRVVGIVAEYNPFHAGHKYHLAQSKALSQASAVVIVMSGHFTQRGEPAIVDKWVRTEMALRQGADLVLELPFVCSTASSDYFAIGAVDILEGLGVVTDLAFGSETADMDEINNLARVLTNESASFKLHLRASIANGDPYARAIEKALAHELYGEKGMPLADGDSNRESYPDLLRKPNHILAVSYAKALMKVKSSIKLIAIERRGAGYHDSIDGSDTYASATGIRQLLSSHPMCESLSHSTTCEMAYEALQPCERYLPSSSVRILADEYIRVGGFMNWKMMETTLLAILRRRGGIDECSIPVRESEGLVDKLNRAVYQSIDIDSLIAALKSKRHHQSRLMRLLVHILVGLTAVDAENIRENRLWRYARILGLSQKGRQIAAKLRKTARIPVITKPDSTTTMMNEWPCIRYDMAATDIYSAHYANVEARMSGQDYKKPPVTVFTTSN